MLASLRGEPLPHAASTPTCAAAGILQRVLARPQGALHSFRRNGRHRTASYATLWHRSGAVLTMLDSFGAKPGQPVVLLADDIIDFAPAFWACLRGGFMGVALMHAARDQIHRRDPAFAQMVQSLGRPIILADDVFADLSSEHPDDFSDPLLRLSDASHAQILQTDIRPADPACLIATSGSTGRPRLVTLTNAALVARNFQGIDAATAGFPPALGVFPLDTMSGQYALYLHNESWVQIRSRELAADPSVVLDAVERFRIASIGLTSSLVARILDSERRTSRTRDLSCLRKVGLGSEPVSARHMQAFAALLRQHGAAAVDVLAGYGTTETGVLVTGSRLGLSSDADEPPALGRAAPGVELRIVGEDNAVLGEGEVGEVEARCPHKLFAGYLGDPDLSREPSAAGDWWRTGDLGAVRDGELVLHGRIKEVLIAGGRKFSLAAIDLVLQDVLQTGERAHCFVARAADGADLLGVALHGEAIGDARKAELSDLIQASVMRRFGLSLATMVTVDGFPQTRNGKLRRAELGRIASGAAAPPISPISVPRAPAATEATISRLAEIWCDVLDLVPPVDAAASFFELGGDSLRALALYTRLSQEFGIHIESDVFFEEPTLTHLGSLAASALTSPVDQPETFWPLSTKLHRRTLAPLETWPGARPTPSRLLLGHHMDAPGVPVVFVINSRAEVGKILQALGPSRPVYLLRSGLDRTDDWEATTQALALRYAEEIAAVHADGPCFIGGHCEGGIVALALAQHVLRRRRHVPLLILMDWSFPLQPYAGRVLLVSGRQNHLQNPRLRFWLPERAWHRAFAACEHVEIDGSFAMNDDSLDALGAVLRGAMDAAMSAPTALLPESAYRATIAIETAPDRMEPGARHRLRASVRNDSDQAWLGWDGQGFSLGARWSGIDGLLLPRHQQHVPLPPLRPQQSDTVELPLVAPDQSGTYRLHLDICEQGNRWFHPDPTRASTAVIAVGRESSPSVRSGPWARLRQRTGNPAPYEFNLRSAALHLLRSGWSTPEEWGVWSLGTAAVLVLPASAWDGLWQARLKLKAFGKSGSQVRVEISAGPSGVPLALTLPANAVVTQTIELPAAEEASIRFSTPDAVSPFGLGVSSDRRQLGIGLIEVALERSHRFRLPGLRTAARPGPVQE